MGVTGLWKLIEPCGQPVPVETLEGKILAVDISIWLHQAVKGFQDNKGSALNNAHLLGLFHRLCKLLYYRVRPVFVFDGCVPQLKRETIARRQQQRSKLSNEADRIQTLLLESLAKEKLIQQALGTNAGLLMKSPVKRAIQSKRNDDVDDMFKLPELPSTSAVKDGDSVKDDSNLNDSGMTSFASDETDDSSFDESNLRHSYNANLQAIDVKSKHFRNLPAEVRHEILVDIKETRKQSSWGRLHELPAKGDDFSVFQMNRLLKRRAVQESLEEAEQEMGGRTLTYAELKNLFTEEGIVEPSALEKGSKQICSDENTRYLLVRDLKKKLSKVEEENEPEQKAKVESISGPSSEGLNCESENPYSQEKIEEIIKANEEDKGDLGGEYETDLQMAIALSLEESTVYSARDYEYENELRLNQEQRKHLKHAATGPARAYMIEYGGMNDDEVDEIMEKTQRFSDEEEESFLQRILNETDMRNAIKSEQTPLKRISEDTDSTEPTKCHNANFEGEKTTKRLGEDSQEIHLVESDDSDTDSDLEEVVDEPKPSVCEKNVTSPSTKHLEIVVNLEERPSRQDDLFADIFGAQGENEKPEKVVSSGKTAIADVNMQPSESEEEKDFVIVNHNKEIEDDRQYIKVDGIKVKKEPKDDEQAKIKSLESRLETESKPSEEVSDSMKSILEELKREAENITKINLDDIKINNAPIEISDEDDCKPEMPKTPVKMELIEIASNDDTAERVQVKTPIALSSPQKRLSKSPMQNTPSKNKSITEFFDVEYVVKRTPDKPKDEDVPKVKSPFFVRRTPKSQRKREGGSSDGSGTASPHGKQLSKATKTLFDDKNTVADDNDLGVSPLKASQGASAEDVLKEAAQVLKETKTEEELQDLASGLAKQRFELEAERNRQDRMGMGISQRMSSECQELLRLFGIPYIVAPMEAEAQCAFLDAVQLTNGTITDDSDIWLFGGRTVYKDFFAQNKHVMEFRAEEIEKSFQCDRHKLIQLACLVGSDYTTGIHGIGTVTALEILATFSAGRDKANRSDGSGGSPAILTTLSAFRDWWRASKAAAMPPGSSTRLSLMKKLKNIEMHEGFPSVSVVEAYLSPKVDDSKEAFTWGEPDVESIREYAKKTLGWTTSKTDDTLRPVLRKLKEKKTQASIRNYFTVTSALSTRQPKVSKRVQKAIDKMSGVGDEATPEKPAKKQRARKATRKRAAESVASEPSTSCQEGQCSGDAAMDTDQEPEPVKKPSRKRSAAATVPRIPDTKEIIPQREKDMETARRHKEKAIEIMKAIAEKKRKS